MMYEETNDEENKARRSREEERTKPADESERED